MYYLVIFLILVFLSFFEMVTIDKKIQLLFSIITFGCVYVTSAFKYETGVDWLAYTNTFNNITPINDIFSINSNVFSDLDFGYSIFLSIVKYFTNDMQVVYFLLASISGFFLVKGLNNYKVSIPVAMLLYYSMIFFVLDMSGVRQCIAVAIFFYSIKFIESKQFLPYFFLIFFATSFHWSAAILLPVYFLGNLVVSNRIGIIYFTISVCILVFKINWLSKIILTIFPFLTNDILVDKLFLYSTNSSFAVQRDLTPFTILNIIFYIISFSIISLKRFELNEKNKYFNIFYNLFLLQVFAFFSMSEFLDMAERLKLYFILSNMVLFFYLLSAFKTIILRFVMYLFIVFFCTISARTFIFNEEFTIAYQPYQNYIICKIFGVASTSDKRINIHKLLNE